MDTVTHPIFERYTLSELALKIGRKEGYLIEIRRGSKPANPMFRALCVGVLKRPEAELFLPVEE